MLRFTAYAPEREVRSIAPEAMSFDPCGGMCTFAVRERDAECVLYELKRAGITVFAGSPRVSYSSPRAYSRASAHVRVR